MTFENSQSRNLKRLSWIDVGILVMLIMSGIAKERCEQAGDSRPSCIRSLPRFLS